MHTPNPTLNLLGKKIFFSALVQYAGRALLMILAALTGKFIANFLSESNYGTYATISEYALFFSMVANLGIFATIVRRMSVDPTNGKIFMNSMYLRIVTALILFVTGIFILMYLGSDFLFILCTSLFLGSLLLDFLTSVCDGMLQANYLMGRATLALVVGKIITFGALYYLLNFSDLPPATGEGLRGIIIIFSTLIIGSLMTFLMSIYFVIKRIKLQWKIDTGFMWEIFRIGVPFGVISIINSLYFRFLPDYFSHIALTSGQFATFSISFRIAQVMSLFSTLLMFSALPGIREYIDQKHWKKLKILYKKIFLVLAIGGAALVVFGSLFGPTILTLLTHEKYFLPEFWYVLPLMLLLAAISYGYDLILITLFAFDRTRWLLSREFFALAIALIFFVSSLYISDMHGKILAIIFGGIVGEATMVIAGLLKTRQILRYLALHQETTPEEAENI